ncbi:hypothetical protein [Exiguobacterium sp. NG55]|uniref:hypothetical protein n=1 Tax=Exiguobacterium sp. NG55 TaxID=375477 RepID=UPI0004DED861|nr:hypothetical protein [Exiguobacterium sp. NG55]
MGMMTDWKMYRVHYLEDGTEQSFVTVADGEAGCRRNLKLLRGEGARFMRNEVWQRGEKRDGGTTEPATTPEAGARIPVEAEERFEQAVLWD